RLSCQCLPIPDARGGKGSIENEVGIPQILDEGCVAAEHPRTSRQRFLIDPSHSDGPGDDCVETQYAWVGWADGCSRSFCSREKGIRSGRALIRVRRHDPELDLAVDVLPEVKLDRIEA